MIVVFSSMLFLLWWNMNTRFKWFVVNFLGFRESEPMLNFLFLWVIASAFMWILDTLRMLWSVTQSASLTLWGYLMLILLLIWIIISFIEVRKWANKNSQRTKILNIVDDEAPQKKSDEKAIQHLFDVDDEDFE
jgi:apolipoprotein N-acyltransferase